MERPIRAAYLNMIKTQLTPLLRQHGFRCTSGSFRHFDEHGDATTIDVQGSAGSWTGESLFYVNVGVATAHWLAYTEARYNDSRFRLRPTAAAAQWFARLLPPAGHGDIAQRWSIRSVDGATACGDTLCELLSETVLPELAVRLDYYRALDTALLQQDQEQLSRVRAQRPEGRVIGEDRLAGAAEHHHPYQDWLLHHRLS